MIYNGLGGYTKRKKRVEYMLIFIQKKKIKTMKCLFFGGAETSVDDIFGLLAIFKSNYYPFFLKNSLGKILSDNLTNSNPVNILILSLLHKNMSCPFQIRLKRFIRVDYRLFLLLNSSWIISNEVNFFLGGKYRFRVNTLLAHGSCSSMMD